MVEGKDLFFITKALYEHVTSSLPKDVEKRERYVEQTEEYVKKRAAALEAFQPPDEMSDMEKKLYRAMLQMNDRIEEELEASKGMMRQSLKQLQQKKQSGERYERPYGGTTVDGVFFDQKN
ncbi:flagellar protein FliT [Alteribacillus persepolensis]|uniref:Flagellar protein FliT n=1 Tax=Alteribacillus persepolensis TaxID=568899 RepID=A0A1G8AGL8_9BACI|nr:hypothetical protein [Alteribacillus persepolensis]SDH20041.1 flagellar protein FliT [Alteribacillus persepolensis]